MSTWSIRLADSQDWSFRMSAESNTQERYRKLGVKLISSDVGFELYQTRTMSWISVSLIMVSIPLGLTSISEGSPEVGIIAGILFLGAGVSTIANHPRKPAALYDGHSRNLSTALDEAVLTEGSHIQAKKFEDGVIELRAILGHQSILIYRWDVADMYYAVPDPAVLRLADKIGTLTELEVEIVGKLR